MKALSIIQKLAALALAAVPLIGFSQPGVDPVPEFEKMIATAREATNTAAPVYLNKSKQQWAKRRFAAVDVKYDVKKTDSLVNPIIGVVTFLLATGQTDLFATKDEADAAQVFDPRFEHKYKVSMTYTFKGSRWAFSKGSYEWITMTALRGTVFEFDETKIRAEPNASPNAALGLWLPK